MFRGDRYTGRGDRGYRGGDEERQRNRKEFSSLSSAAKKKLAYIASKFRRKKKTQQPTGNYRQMEDFASEPELLTPDQASPFVIDQGPEIGPLAPLPQAENRKSPPKLGALSSPEGKRGTQRHTLTGSKKVKDVFAEPEESASSSSSSGSDSDSDSSDEQEGKPTRKNKVTA